MNRSDYSAGLGTRRDSAGVSLAVDGWLEVSRLVRLALRGGHRRSGLPKRRS